MQRFQQHSILDRILPLLLRRTLVAMALAGLMLSSAGTAQAQDVWNGGSATAGPTNGFWSTAANWVAGTSPVANDSLTFNAPVAGGTRTTTNDLTAGTQYNNITINGGQFFLSGNSISLGGTNPQFVVNSGTETINLNIALQQNSTFQVNTGGSNPLLINGVISGAFGVTKTGVSLMRYTALQTYSGDTTISGGTLDATGDFLPSGTGKGNVTIANGATLQMNNGSVTVNGLNGGGTVGKLGSGGRILTVGGNNANGNFSGNFVQTAGTISVNKVGSGTQILSGSMNENGSITVSGGTLLFNGTQTAGISNAFIVNAGATLGGNGTILLESHASVVVSNGGTLAPGNSPGLLTINGGGLKLLSNSNYSVELNGLTLGSTYDSTLISGSGFINISNSLLSVSLGFTPNVGDKFDIITNMTGNAILGTFAGLADGSTFTAGGTDLEITYFGGTGNDVVLSVVPEPSSLLLTAAGVALMTVVRRRSRLVGGITGRSGRT